MAKHPGLYRRGATWWYRKQLPIDVRPVLGQTEIKQSLETADYGEAVGRYLTIAAEVERKVVEARKAKSWGDWPARSDQEINLIVHDWWLVARESLAGPFSPGEPRFYDDGDLTAHLTAYLAERGIVAPAGSATWHRIKRSARFEAGIFAQAAARFAEGTAHAEADVRLGRDRSPELAVTDELRQTIENPPISVMLEKYLVEQKLDAKIAGEWRRAVKLFKESVGGDIGVRSITKAHLREFKDRLLTLPRTLPNAVRALPLPKIVERCRADADLAKREKVTPATVNKTLSAIRCSIGYAVENGYAEDNPAVGVTARDPNKKRRKRHPYSDSDLALIFHAGVFAKCPPLGAQGADYWLPLLGLFTGARLEEMGQALVTDVVEGPVHYLDINEEGEGGSVKTEGSVRRVPLHSILIELGFFDYVRALRTAGQVRLFPDLRPDRHGSLTQGFSKRWGRFTDKLGIVDRRKSFHSLRHGFIDACRAARVPKDIRMALTGHEGEDVHDDYGLGFPLPVLAEAVGRVGLPVDLSHLVIGGPKP